MAKDRGLEDIVLMSTSTALPATQYFVSGVDYLRRARWHCYAMRALQPGVRYLGMYPNLDTLSQRLGHIRNAHFSSPLACVRGVSDESYRLQKCSAEVLPAQPFLMLHPTAPRWCSENR